MPRYRTATPADERALHALWAAAFPDSAGTVALLWGRDPGRHARTFVAEDGGRPVSVLHYQPRPIRSATGGPQRVGCLGSVATHPDARGRGHVRRLLAAATEAMTADACAWSLLFTGTPDVYRGAGWQPFTAPVLSGPLAAPAPRGDGAGAVAVRRAGQADVPALRALRDAYDAARPLTTVRSPEDWRRRIPVWYGAPAAILLAEEAGDGGEGGEGAPLGFVVVRPTGPAEAAVEEIALARGREPETARALLSAAAGRARAAGATTATARLPAEPAVVAALPRLLDGVTAGTTAYGMARPLLASAAEVTATVTAPGAVHWYGDSF
ncbi:GNAT family N-acetyltransferase [Streptomyces sp. NRRL F-5123]|uniref:GNAT family N-acetyltransferase n=1 Tax=Streptomyces sp. NRRL F-5123 TaxID=1463856 RepID=UPI0004E166D4|nr:GNAT family N-acetyltransferase [Streptomyces sp. NRRL F-5123]